MNRKTGILLIILCIVSNTCISCSKKETVNWKTYSHSLFSFQYPSEWVMEERIKYHSSRTSNKWLNINMRVDYNNPDWFYIGRIHGNSRIAGVIRDVTRLYRWWCQTHQIQ